MCIDTLQSLRRSMYRGSMFLIADSMQKLASTGELAYLGHQWRRSVACAGGDLAMQGDISARTLIFNVPDVDASRRQRLIDLLDIDLEWHMHCVSDGQRRRVQICMGLLKPFKVLLMDEVRILQSHTTRAPAAGARNTACKAHGLRPAHAALTSFVRWPLCCSSTRWAVQSSWLLTLSRDMRAWTYAGDIHW